MTGALEFMVTCVGGGAEVSQNVSGCLWGGDNSQWFESIFFRDSPPGLIFLWNNTSFCCNPYPFFWRVADDCSDVMFFSSSSAQSSRCFVACLSSTIVADWMWWNTVSFYGLWFFLGWSDGCELMGVKREQVRVAVVLAWCALTLADGCFAKVVVNLLVYSRLWFTAVVALVGLFCFVLYLLPWRSFVLCFIEFSWRGGVVDLVIAFYAFASQQ